MNERFDCSITALKHCFSNGAPMNNDIVILVGDRFADFSNNPEVFCLSDFVTTARLGNVAKRRLYLGQGISQQNIDIVCSELQTYLPECQAIAPKRASQKVTHKIVPQNIMISEPRQLDVETFEVDLLLDERSADISDHQTGQHIQGLALIEAARQTWTAVSETYLLHEGQPTRFVLDEISSRFLNFVFPLPALLRLKLLDTQTSPMQSVYSVSVIVEQAGQKTAEIQGKFRVIDERVNARLEAIASRKAVVAFLTSMESNPVKAK